MIDPDFEIRKLRWTLQEAGYDTFDIDDICSRAFDSVTNAILNQVSDATADAVSYAEQMGIEDFLSDVDVEQNGWFFQIVTRSGKTDYSIAKVENLPNLLKNAKVAADGTRYKVIPMREKVKPSISMFDTMKNQQHLQRETRAALQQKNVARSEKANSIVDGVRESLAKGFAARKETRTGGEPFFRTATSKQDPTSKWVIPDISRDMTQYLFDLNDKLNHNIDEAVFDVLAGFIREFT